jgi:hypothetical protein
MRVPLTDLSRDLRDRDAERGEAVQDGDTNLELCDLMVEVSRHETLTQQFHTMHLGFDAASAVVAAPSSPDRTAEVFRCPQCFVACDRACRDRFPRLATTLDEGFVVGMRSFAGNPYDGHTLKEALEQVTILTDQRPDLAVVDRGYRGHGVEATRVLISGTRRGLTPKLISDLRRRSAIEAEIGHMKTDGRLARCPLKGTIGAVLCACGHNIRKILAHLRAWLAWMIAAILNAVYHPGRQYQAVTAA